MTQKNALHFAVIWLKCKTALILPRFAFSYLPCTLFIQLYFVMT